MDLGLSGKVALVTAASKGIGKAVAKSLAMEGARVIISSSNMENLIQAKEEINKVCSSKIDVVLCDLSKRDSVLEFLDVVRRDLPPVDIFVSNTGGTKPGTLLELSEEDWYEAVELVLMSAVRITKSLLPHMISQKWGRMIYLTSIAVKEPIPYLLLSNVLRTGVNALSKSNTMSFSKDNVLFNAICQGWTYTERVKKILQSKAEETSRPFDEIKGEHEKTIPMERYATPIEIAEVVTFLCSDQASYVAGNAMQIDGGYTKCII